MPFFPSSPVEMALCELNWQKLRSNVDDFESRIAALEVLIPVVGCSLRATDPTNPVAAPYPWQAISLSDERLDSNTSHAPGGANWTVPKTGWYDLSVMGCWDTNPSGNRGVKLIDTSDTNRVLIADECQATPNAFTQHGHSVKRFLTVGHVLEFQAQQLNSAAIVSHRQGAGTADGSGFDCFYVGP